MKGLLYPPVPKAHMASFRRTPESSFIKTLDTGFCRCDEFPEMSFHLKFKEPSHVAQPS